MGLYRTQNRTELDLVCNVAEHEHNNTKQKQDMI